MHVHAIWANSVRRLSLDTKFLESKDFLKGVGPHGMSYSIFLVNAERVPPH